MKNYKVTTHAIQRAVERLGTMKTNARALIIDRMQTAVFQGEVAQGRIFDHYPSRTRFVLAKNEDTVITVYSMDVLKDGSTVIVSVSPKQTLSNAIIEKAHAVIKRELAKSRRSFNAEYRALSLEQAEVAVEIAQANVKKVRCKAPHTKALIQERIDALSAYHQTIEAKLVAIKDEHERLTAEAMAFVGSEVNV